MSTPSDSNSFLAQATNHMDLIQKKTGINPKIVLGILGGCAALTLVGFLDQYITCFIGIALPTYWSIKAIESDEEDDDKQWLTYWAVYAVFTFFDLFANWVMAIIPFYFFLKLIFLIWCFMPNTMGALFIYNHFIKKFFKIFEKQLDKFASKIVKTGEEYTKKAKEVIKENQENIMNAGVEAAKQLTKATKSE